MDFVLVFTGSGNANILKQKTVLDFVLVFTGSSDSSKLSPRKCLLFWFRFSLKTRYLRKKSKSYPGLFSVTVSTVLKAFVLIHAVTVMSQSRHCLVTVLSA